MDASGNVFIADRRNDLIRKVDTSGTISTIAGTGTPGYTGDGGSALLADIEIPFSVAVDRTGNVYLGGNCDPRYCSLYRPFHFIRKVDPSGIITTFAGGFIPGFGGDGGPAASRRDRRFGPRKPSVGPAQPGALRTNR